MIRGDNRVYKDSIGQFSGKVGNNRSGCGHMWRWTWGYKRFYKLVSSTKGMIRTDKSI